MSTSASKRKVKSSLQQSICALALECLAASLPDKYCNCWFPYSRSALGAELAAVEILKALKNIPSENGCHIYRSKYAKRVVVLAVNTVKNDWIVISDGSLDFSAICEGLVTGTRARTMPELVSVAAGGHRRLAYDDKSGFDLFELNEAILDCVRDILVSSDFASFLAIKAELSEQHIVLTTQNIV